MSVAKESAPVAAARGGRDYHIGHFCAAGNGRNARRRCDNHRLHDRFRRPARPTRGAIRPSPGTAPASRGRGKVHRWFFVREIHRGDDMESSATSLKRAPAAAPAPPAPAEPNGSEILVRCLQAENVRYLWGYPGGAVLYIYDALYKQETIQHVLVRHEQAAIHAADGYARATGEVGVALVTSGPGRDERGYRHRHRLHGLDPDGDRDRTGADAGDRPRRLPGVRHGRHHATDRQAQLPRQGRRAISRRRSRRRSTSPAPAGPARSSSTSRRTCR